GWLARRTLSEFAIWWECDPPDAGTRDVDEAPWTGMPPAMADMHTPEGKRRGTPFTILCGHPRAHVQLMRYVREHDWGWVRERVHSEPAVEGVVRTTMR